MDLTQPDDQTDDQTTTFDPAPKQDDKKFLAEISADFKRLQGQKSKRTGGIEGRVLLNLAMVLGEHYTIYQNRQILSQALDPNKLSLVFNLTDRRVNKLIGRLCSVGGTYKSNPDRRDPKAFSESEVVDRMIKALDQKLDQPSRDREIFFWLLVGGVAFEKCGWVKNATIEPKAQFDENNELLFTDLLTKGQDGEPVRFPESQVKQQIQNGRPPEQFEVYEDVEEVGEVESKVYGPLQVFLDMGVRSVADLQPDQAIYVAEIKTQGWIAENFGEEMVQGLPSDSDLMIVTTKFQQMEGSTVAGITLKDMIPVVQGSVGPDDPPMNVVIERYQPASKKNPHGKYTCFIPDQKILYDGDIEFENSEIPIVDFHWKPVTISFWTKDYVTDLIAPQRFLNKRMSQLGEQSNASIYDKVLLGPGLTEHDIPADYPGLIKNGMSDQGVPLVARLAGPALPGWFMQSLDLTLKLMDDIAGGTDLTENSSFPGQLRGPMAVPMLQEIIDTEWGPTYNHIGERMARVKQMRLNRIKQFYPPLRTMHYMDRSQRDEVFEFHTDKILRSGTNFNVTVERGSLLPELRALREARVRERLASPLSILYIDERTGKLDKSKIAEDLQFGDVGRDSKESQYRKLGAEVVGRLWRAEPVPPVLPFQNHGVMMDELEAAMATTEFFSASPQIQQAFMARWQQHQQFLQQAAEKQQQTMENQMVRGAVAQATQQVAAETATQTAHSVVAQQLAQLQQQIQGAQAQNGAIQGGMGPGKVQP